MTEKKKPKSLASLVFPPKSEAASSRMDSSEVLRWIEFLSDKKETNTNEARNTEARRQLIDDKETRSQVRQLETEIANLKSQINSKTESLLEQKVDAKEKEKQIEELKKSLAALEEKQNLSHLLTRVGMSAQQKLLSSLDFRNMFNDEVPRNAYVMSIDIRRSTELMLKAREPKLYAQFIMALASQMREKIIENYGVFDKFTGDGILAFFPDFYSGEDAGYFAVKAATDCHTIFETHYEENKSCFLSILRDIGLGIGLDYGQVQIVQIGGDLTVVGTPVVYACRMGGAEAGHTYINQPAFEQLFEKYSAFCDFEEREINFKHEGSTLAYSIELNGKEYLPAQPKWCQTEGGKANRSDDSAAESSHG